MTSQVKYAHDFDTIICRHIIFRVFKYLNSIVILNLMIKINVSTNMILPI